ncbi:helix-turn-helix transcriptional regulator [Chitinophaga sp.]|uniref:helix-turn-helix domain-containing protein n=1 Tax=Chitinophaga sp. TaxID=1869181 RepID=UPI0031DA5762
MPQNIFWGGKDSPRYKIISNLARSGKILTEYFCQFGNAMIDEKQLLIDFGLRVRSFREKKKMTLLDLEISTGISEGALSKIENGKKNINITTAIRLAKGLEVAVSELFKGI